MVLPKGINMKYRSATSGFNAKLYVFMIFSFVITLIFLIYIENKKYVRINIYLPHINSAELSKEVRFIPKSGSRIEKIRWIMGELISGPLNSEHLRVFNPDTKIRDIFIEKGVMYINFDWMIVEAFHKNYSQVVSSIKKTIADNFSGIREVRLLIDGVEPILYKGPIVLKLR